MRSTASQIVWSFKLMKMCIVFFQRGIGNEGIGNEGIGGNNEVSYRLIAFTGLR